jgi:hypothetical protein
MRDSLYDDVAARFALAPANRLAAATVNGASVDTAGAKNFFRVGMVVVLAGAVTDGTHTIAIEDSDTGSGGWAPIAAGNLEGTPPAITSAQANTTARVAFSGHRRYVRVSVTTASATVGGTVGAVILLSAGSGRPVT